MDLVQNKYKKHPRRCSEDQDNLRYALITFVLRYTSHSGDKALTQVIWVLRKPTRVFLLFCSVWKFTHSNTMFNHGLRALVRGLWD